MILQGTNLVNIAEWKAQEGVDREFEFSDFDEESEGVVFSQLKITLRSYGGGKPMGIRSFSINSKDQKKASNKSSKPLDTPLPTLALEEESDDEREIIPSLKSASSTIIDDRLAELKQRLHKEKSSQPAPAALTPTASSVSYVVKVANQAEFDPGYKPEEEEAPAPNPAPVKKSNTSSVSASSKASSSAPLAHVTLSVSGIGPERSEIRRILTELGGTYEHDLPSSVPTGRTLILLVDASSNQWRNTPKHAQAEAQDVPIVDKSWLTACSKKGSFLAVGPYLHQFRTGEGKASSSTAAPSVPASAPIAAPGKPKKSSIKSEGGAFSTDKAAKGDELEDDGPDEYEYDGFVVPDDEEIEYFDDDEEDNLYYNPHGAHSTHKSAPPKVSQINNPALVLWTSEESAMQLSLFAQKCSAILGRPITSSSAHIAASTSHTEGSHNGAKSAKETTFGMDVDEVASDGTVEMEVDERNNWL